MRALHAVVVLGVWTGVAEARTVVAKPAYDASALDALDASVTALVVDRADCSKVTAHVDQIAPQLDTIRLGRYAPSPARKTLPLPAARVQKLGAAIDTIVVHASACASKIPAADLDRLAGYLIEVHGSLLAAPVPPQATDAGVPPVAPRPLDDAAKRRLALYDFVLASIKYKPSADRGTALYLRAVTNRQFDQLAPAITDYTAVYYQHPTHERAEAAVDGLLDLHVRLGQHDNLGYLARSVASDAKFLADKPRLKQRVTALHRTLTTRTAETCFADASKSGSPGRFRGCGNQFREAFDADPKASGADELLWSAAIAYERAGVPVLVLEQLDKLERDFPTTKRLGEALSTHARIHSQVGAFDKAAAVGEQLAKRFPADRLADPALANAVDFRLALGDVKGAIAAFDRYVRQYGTKQPDEVGRLLSSLLEVHVEANDAIAIERTAKALTKRGSQATATMQARAYLALGRSLARRACPRPLVDGFCLEVTGGRGITPPPSRALPVPTCGPDGYRVRVFPRTAPLVREAAVAFEHVIRIAKGNGLDQLLATATAESADLAVESVLFSAAPARVKGFEKWFDDRSAALSRALDPVDVLASSFLPTPPSVLSRHLAAAKQLHADIALTAPTPTDARTPDTKSAFCSLVDNRTRPLLAKAAHDYMQCASYGAMQGFSRDHEWCYSRFVELDRGSKRWHGDRVPAPTFVSIPLQLEVPPYLETAELAALVRNPLPADCTRVAKSFLDLAKTIPSPGPTYHQAAIAHHRCRNFAGAEAAYAEAFKRDWHNAYLIANRATLAVDKGGSRIDARKVWEAQLAAQPALAATRVNLGMMMIDDARELAPSDVARTRLLDGAYTQFTTALSRDASLRHAYVGMIVVHLLRATPHRVRAAQLLASIAAPDRAHHTPALELARLAAQWHAGDAGLSIATALGRRTDDEAKFQAALVGLANGDFRSSHTLLDTIKQPAYPYEHALALGIAARTKMQPSWAETAYAKAIQLAPARPEAHHGLGLHHARLGAAARDRTSQLAAYQQAAKHLRDAVARAKGWPLEADATAELAAVDRAIATITAPQSPPATP